MAVDRQMIARTVSELRAALPEADDLLAGLLLVPLAGLTMLVGVRWGDSLYRLLEAPTARRIATVGLTAVLVPLFTGLLDLLLRHTTP